MAFDPTQPKDVYMAMEYEGIGKSDNSGETIQPINNGFVDRRISAVTVAGDKLVAIETGVGDTTGVYVSGDQGNSWQQMQNARGLGGVHLKAIVGTQTDPHFLLAASPQHMYKSTDGGASWKPVAIRQIIAEQPKPATTTETRTKTRTASRGKTAARTRVVKPRIITREISPSDIAGLYAVNNGAKTLLFAATNLGLLRSDDMGELWKLADLPGSTGASAFYAAPNNTGFLIVRAAAGLYTSKDFGEHWEQLMFPKPASEINDVAVPGDEKSPLLVATTSGLFSSADGGKQWSQITTGLPSSTFNSVTYSPSNPSLAYAVEYGQLFQTSDAGASWTAVPTSLPALRIRQLWMPDKNTNRLYGVTNDLGILFRN
jgi:photosystem II stability/assembly factor-like uncharacterized protein